jgi:hypothetical protein
MLRTLPCLLIALSVIACGKIAPAPVDPVWGTQPCGHCQMVVGDRDTAAQWLGWDGKRHWFADIGCLVAHEREHGPHTAAAWVRAYGHDQWIAKDSRRFAPGYTTPMDFGFVAKTSGPGVAWPAVVAAVTRKLDQREDDHAQR